MADAVAHQRQAIGACAFVAAIVFVLWLPLGIAGWAPFVLSFADELPLRLHAGAAVGSLLVAAWGFWER